VDPLPRIHGAHTPLKRGRFAVAGSSVSSSTPSQVRQLVEALALWVRDETGRAGERASDGVGATLRELGFVTRSDYEELELRVAQLEHRLRLLEALPPPVTLDADGAGDPESRPPL
jgi:hypothetical protein